MSVAIVDTIVNIAPVIETVYTESMPRLWPVAEETRVRIVIVVMAETHMQRMCKSMPRVEMVKKTGAMIVSMTKYMMYGTRCSMEYASKDVAD